jgi:prepilin-type processing-associated H-X9-DG protein
LKQLGLAIHSYDGDNRCLPLAIHRSYDPRLLNLDRNPNYVDASLFIRVLPYLGEGPIYESYNSQVSIFGPENRTCACVNVGHFTCPSDTVTKLLPPGYSPPPPLSNVGDDGWLLPLTSYVGNFASFDVWPWPDLYATGQVPQSVWRQVDGVFNNICPMKTSHITDGLGKTCFLAERSAGAIARRFSGTTADGNFNFVAAGHVDHTLGDFMYAPNLIQRGSLRYAGVLHGIQSEHPGGVHCLFGDGSVQFVGDNVDSWDYRELVHAPDNSWTNIPRTGIWQGLSTRAGNDPSL